VLLNDETGKRTLVNACGANQSSPPGSVFGAQWIAFDCSHNPKRPFQLYNVQTRQWRRLRCDRACKRYYNYLGIAGVGAKWLVAEVAPHQSCGPNDYHNDCGPAIYLYYNIATGRRGFPHPGANDILNLDSPTITSPVCSPVSLPPGSPLVPPALGFDRGFAFVQSQNGIYVQRCGSSRQTYLTNAYNTSPFWGGPGTHAFFANQHAAGFGCAHDEGQTLAFDFSGIFLPSLTPFTATLPKYSFCAMLGPHHLYILSGPTDQLMAATFPLQPPSSGTLRRRERPLRPA
jgi:hypothetical protein